MNTKILIVEDDPHILLGLEEILKGERFEVAVCSRGDLAVESVRRHQPSLVVLDVMLPGANGFDVCKQLREQHCAAPILMLTAKAQEIDKVIGLDAGADDYVTKPFGVRELIARVHALLRRPGARRSVQGEEPFQIGSASIDPKRLELRRGRLTEILTPKELRLLQFFQAHPGEVLSRNRLLDEVWGYHYFGTTRTLDQVIVQLRKKLGDRADQPKHLLTVHGVGYKLVL